MHILILTRYWPFDMVTKKIIINFFYLSIRKFQGLLFICWSTVVESYKSFLWKLVDLARNKKYAKIYTSHKQLFR